MAQGLKACKRACASLRYAYHLALADQNLTAADAGEAHLTRPSRLTAGRRNLHIGRHSKIAECVPPQLAHPHHRFTDVVAPQHIIGRDHQVEPHELAGHQQHGSPTTSSPHNGDVESVGNATVHIGIALRGPQHQRSSLDDVERGRTHGLRISRMKLTRIADRLVQRPTLTHPSTRGLRD